MQKSIITLILCLVFGYTTHAQSPNTNENNIEATTKTRSTTEDIRRGTVQNPSMTAVRIESNSMIQLDGYLDENIWNEAPYATDFTQRFPEDGGTPSQRTEARILYTTPIFLWV